MSYHFSRFGSLMLPSANPTIDVGTGESMSDLHPVVHGGAYDGFGSEQARQKPVTITYNCMITGRDMVEVQTKFDLLRGAIGTRAKLYRRLPGGAEHWITARLTNVVGTHSTTEPEPAQTVILTFHASEYPWHGGYTHLGFGWLLDTGFYFDSGLYFDEVLWQVMPHAGSLTFINSGNYPVRNAILQISCDPGSPSPILVIRIEKAGQTDLTYTPLTNIVAGTSLILDCGKFTVQNNGVDDYQALTRNVAHVITEWLCIDPGVNTITFTMGGPTATGTIAIACEDGWA